jgi:hypothetical protein
MSRTQESGQQLGQEVAIHHRQVGAILKIRVQKNPVTRLKLRIHAIVQQSQTDSAKHRLR